MIENRPRGRNLAKIVSYGYVAIGILLSIVTIALNSMAGRFVTIAYQQGRVEDANKYFSLSIIRAAPVTAKTFHANLFLQ